LFYENHRPYKKRQRQNAFFFEIVPPQKGVGIADLYKNIDPLMEFKPPFIDVTTSEKNIFFWKEETV
jgi:methylenetetrahydrofolate reductase (NADPH)